MDKQPVGQLPDLTQSNNDDEIMVITNSEYNQLKKEKIADFITDLTSTDENNAIVKGTDGKMFVTDFGNASNITEGTLPVEVLPNIPKDKLPEIETDDLPDSGITAGTYTYPTDIVVNSKGQVTSITEGQAGANNANQDLSNLGPLGLDKLNQSKALETGSVSSDADVYADVLKYKNSGTGTGIDVIKPDNFEVVGTPTISDDGIASGLDNTNYLTTTLNLSGEVIIKGSFKPNGANPSGPAFIMQIQDKEGNATEGVNLYQYSHGSFEFNYRHNNTSYYNVGQFHSNTEFNYTIIINSTSMQYIVYQNTNEIFNKTMTSNIPVLNGEFFSKIGHNNLVQGSVDLNSVQILNNGNLIYQPCLKIPYTLSKTGSKIVDAAYRDRVQDMYEQYGYAPYYTIDKENENFSLPMGEIYGMIAQNKTSDGFSLFDIKLTDRILSGDEAIGWALQGALITMTYPDAVNKIKELYADGTDTTFRGISCKKTTDGRYIADISQKTAIDNLFNTTGIADFYILDNTNNQFYLPRNKYFMQLTDSTTLLNNYNEAGLPNITGYVNGTVEEKNTYSGCFYNNGTNGSGANGGYTDQSLGFDASRSNAVYGNSDTVQPPSSSKLLYYKVGNTIVNESTIDIGNVLSDLQLKADVDLSNSTPNESFKVSCMNWTMPDYDSMYSIAMNTLTQSPTDGIIIAMGGRNAMNVEVANVFVGPDSETLTQITNTRIGAGANDRFTVTVPIAKGYWYKVEGDGSTLPKFIPLKGVTNA